MAVLAVVAALDVAGGLAEGGDAVVAAEAVGGDAGVIEDGAGEGGGGVAVLAVVAALDVVRGFAGGGDRPASGVAHAAIVGRAQERAPYVAPVASHGLVAPGERKPGREVIEDVGCYGVSPVGCE